MNAISRLRLPTDPSIAVDELGTLKAAIAELTAQEKVLKEYLTDCGIGEYEGEAFRVTVTESERNSLDMDAVRAKLSPQFIAAHTTTTAFVTVRCVARTRK